MAMVSRGALVPLILLIVLFGLVSFGLPNVADSSSSKSCAAPMPNGFDWPADPASLYKISGGIHSSSSEVKGSIDAAAQRRHGWLLFAGVTQASSESEAALPVFHTWYTVEEAFDSTVGKVNCASRKQPIRLSLPTQLIMVAPNPATEALKVSGFDPSPRFDPDFTLLRSITAVPLAQAHAGIVGFSHVAFNGPMYEYIRDNQYYSKKVLTTQIDKDVALKSLVDPPKTGISLKFSWWPVASDHPTPMPVWDFDPRFPGDAKNPPTSWKRVVVIDPIGNSTSPATVSLGGFDHSSPSVVPLSKLYSVRVTADEAALANADFRIKAAATDVLGRPLKEGDYLAMTAMHIATREFDPWVFATFWWTDKPNEGPLASDMPNEVKGVFRNYIMDVSYNINRPEANGKAPVAYNPWLELFQLGGTRSQCMACHARAAFGAKVVAFFNPVDMKTADSNGFDASPQSETDPNFQKGTLSLHRIWTIFTRAQ